MLSLKTLVSTCLLLGGSSASLAQAPAGTVPAVTAPAADLTVPALGVKNVDLSTVFGLPSVTGPVVQFSTVLGNLNVELYPQFAPLTCANFLGYVNSGAYNNTIITRSVPGFVEQGGEYTIALPDALSQIAPGPPVKNEFNVSNTRGTVAMAKLGSDPNSATDTWFFNLADNSANLDNQNGGFTVFARVLGTGMTVMDAIAAAPVVDLSSLTNADFTATPLINIPSSGNITVTYGNWVRLPSIAPIPIYPTASTPGVLSFAATSSNPAAITVVVSGSTVAVTAGPSGSASITVTATDTNGNQASTTFNATVGAVPATPVFTLQPVSQTVVGGTTVVFSSAASGSPAPTFQWKLNATAIPAATSARLVITGAASANTGSYTCVATNSQGSATSSPATLSLTSTGNVGRLINLSVNTTAGKSQILTVGFVTGGAATSGSQTVLIRATGPALSAFGVQNFLVDPVLTLFSGAASINSNDNWATPASNQAAVTLADTVTGAFALSNSASLDAALVTALTAGGYTVQISGNTAATGTALAEVYDDTPANTYTPATPRLINISSNNLIAANGSMTAGFVIGGTTAKTVLIRATGPALAALGVSGTMPDPQLALHTTLANGQDSVLASNAAWGGDPQIAAVSAAVGAFPLSDSSSKDSVVLMTLPPGDYTAVASSVTGTAGIALIEVYEVP